MNVNAHNSAKEKTVKIDLRNLDQLLILQLTALVVKDILFPSDVTVRYLEGFYDHLEKRFKGETPITYFKRVKNS